MTMRSLAVALAAPILLTGCAMSAQQAANADQLNPRQMALLDRELGGKVAGEPRNCMPLGSQAGVETIRVSDNVLLYRVSRNLVFKNDLNGGCPGLARDSDIIVTQQWGGSGPCRGDIIRLVDRVSGIQGASCSLGQFTPYRTPGSNAR
jgi:hypothetical protein